MADDSKKPAEGQKKQRWYNNLIDAYKVTARVYKWLPWAMAGASVLLIAGSVAFALVSGSNIFMWIFTGIMLSLLACMIMLTFLVKRALYTQLDGTVGGTYAVISNIKKGWIVDEQPIAVTKEQDLVWRLIGRPGVVFVSEGAHSKVAALLGAERKRVNKVAQNVPVSTLEVGPDEGQLKLVDLEKALKKLPKHLTKEEVPVVAARLKAVQGGALPIPKGVDPSKARPNRRAMRGR